MAAARRRRRRTSTGPLPRPAAGVGRCCLASLLAAGLWWHAPHGLSFLCPGAGARRPPAAAATAAPARRPGPGGRAAGVARQQASQTSAAASPAATDAEAELAGVAEEDARASEEAYEIWRDQFPLAAARRDYYGLLSDRPSVRVRFLRLASLVGIPAPEALEMFRRDMWVLSEPTETIPKKLEALRSVAESEEEVLDFLRAAPRAIATTTAVEMRERGLANMKIRATVGDIYEMIISPARFVVKQLAASNARELESKLDAEKAGSANEGVIKEARENQRGLFQVLTIAFFGGWTALLVWAAYMDANYGGPIHGKGFCFPAGVVPSYNIPDDEGNARLPCSCAPLYKWYLEPLMSDQQRTRFLGMRPKVESKNCGRLIGGQKRECDPTTIGGCVWTAEDLEKDPSTWDRREPTYWERQRLAKEQ